MAISRGKVHTYLVMTLDFTLPGKVKILMCKYIEEIILVFDKADSNGGGNKKGAAPLILFRIDEDCKKIDTQKSTEFHNIVAKPLYATKRARPDTCTLVAYLTTRVREPDIDDWAKLAHLIKYLRGYQEPTAHYECRRQRYTQVVGGWIVWGTPQHGRPHWRWIVHGKRISHHRLNKTEAEHKKFHRSRTCRCG
jgi:hypothetical protein